MTGPDAAASHDEVVRSDGRVYRPAKDLKPGDVMPADDPADAGQKVEWVGTGHGSTLIVWRLPDDSLYPTSVRPDHKLPMAPRFVLIVMPDGDSARVPVEVWRRHVFACSALLTSEPSPESSFAEPNAWDTDETATTLDRLFRQSDAPLGLNISEWAWSRAQVMHWAECSAAGTTPELAAADASELRDRHIARRSAIQAVLIRHLGGQID